jgi:ectoine hydroxylase-related dioxygenase (phytanoyl-CoA dioxygenase family)
MNTSDAVAAPDYGAPSVLRPTHLLSPEQISFYRENGYLAVDAVMPASEIATVRAIYDRLFNEDREKSAAGFHDLAGAGGEGKKVAIPQILEPSKFAPALLQTQLVANLKAMMQQLHGPETRMVSDHAINKSPRSAAPTPWHQDEAYWDPAKDYSSLSVWVPLQPATKVNGCMHFVPGSHRLEVVPHQPIGGNPLTPGLEVVPGSFDFSQAVACELPAGGATFHDGKTLHYTPPNGSNDYRRAYIAIGAAWERPRAVARVFPWQELQAAAKAKKRSEAGVGA